MSNDARFHFTKILVTDPEAQFAFYSSVLGMAEKYRVRNGEGDNALEEIIMTPAGGGDPTLVLLHYLNRPKPTPGEAVLGFSVPDLEATVRQAVAAGGTVAVPPKAMPEFGISVAFVLDPEGHRLELIQPL
ncbi:VOC family protein [Streptomyces sp. NPDC055681]